MFECSSVIVFKCFFNSNTITLKHYTAKTLPLTFHSQPRFDPAYSLLGRWMQRRLGDVRRDASAALCQQRRRFVGGYCNRSRNSPSFALVTTITPLSKNG